MQQHLITQHQEMYRDLVMFDQNEAFPTTLGTGGQGTQTETCDEGRTESMASSAV
jgi:hypothetical protein